MSRSARKCSTFYILDICRGGQCLTIFKIPICQCLMPTLCTGSIRWLITLSTSDVSKIAVMHWFSIILLISQFRFVLFSNAGYRLSKVRIVIGDLSFRCAISIHFGSLYVAIRCSTFNETDEEDEDTPTPAGIIEPTAETTNIENQDEDDWLGQNSRTEVHDRPPCKTRMQAL